MPASRCAKLQCARGEDLEKGFSRANVATCAKRVKVQRNLISAVPPRQAVQGKGPYGHNKHAYRH